MKTNPPTDSEFEAMCEEHAEQLRAIARTHLIMEVVQWLLVGAAAGCLVAGLLVWSA